MPCPRAYIAHVMLCPVALCCAMLLFAAVLCNAMPCLCAVMYHAELCWAVLCWDGLGWAGLGCAVLGWAGLGWGRTDLCWCACDSKVFGESIAQHVCQRALQYELPLTHRHLVKSLVCLQVMA